MANKPFLYLIHYTPAIGWGILICYFSLMPGQEVPGMFKMIQDGLIHFFIYSVLSFLLTLPSTGFKIKKTGFKLLAIIIAFCSGYGFILELIQEHFIAGRTFEWSDVIANSLGAASILLMSFGKKQ